MLSYKLCFFSSFMTRQLFMFSLLHSRGSKNKQCCDYHSKMIWMKSLTKHKFLCFLSRICCWGRDKKNVVYSYRGKYLEGPESFVIMIKNACAGWQLKKMLARKELRCLLEQLLCRKPTSNGSYGCPGFIWICKNPYTKCWVIYHLGLANNLVKNILLVMHIAYSPYKGPLLLHKNASPVSTAE